MIKEILTLLGMFGAGILLGMIIGLIANNINIRPKIFNRIKTTIKDNLKINSSIGKVYKKDGTEVISGKKFADGMLSYFNPTLWLKDISRDFNVRQLTIYVFIIGIIFAYGYFKGKSDTPIQTNLDYDKEFIMNLNGEYLHKEKYSNDIYVKDSKTHKILKHLKAKDFPLLRKKLQPIGLILQPIAVAGGGLGLKGANIEAGAGISFVKYWKWKLDTFLTNKGIYLGTSYRITDNSGVGIAGGKGFKGDNRAILYYNWRF